MNKILQKYMTVVCIAFGSFAFGQFNTLKPSAPKKQETNITSDSDNSKITEPQKERKEKKSWKDVFGITTKADLKNEIDSLKAMIKESLASNNTKWNLKKSQDSLLFSFQSKMIDQPQNNRNRFAQYDFVNEPKEANFSKIVMPLNRKISVTSPYGTRIHPIFGTSKFHNGVDLAAHYENVYSVLDGIVTETGWDNKGGGNYIKIRHFNRFETAYLHLSEIYYRAGEQVNAGFIIAKSGNSGNSTGPHLHFSVKEFGQSINPAHFLNDLIKVNNLIALYNE
ncbi:MULTISPECIES: M23 family metallopeptidase [Empedobacter]|uniref:M23 family metallopeptidase n=1 Tax=Empedobacter TaxID=59734 RepID=UPI002574936B|nr:MULTISPECIES: M23 family metallopeptidase [Empedobacter]MDM1040178.1 M23 family metallopeptidase [Empedobacter brevis]MDM1134110.1 M23 family metallopeptidase [Empedobacter sp. R750]